MIAPLLVVLLAVLVLGFAVAMFVLMAVTSLIAAACSWLLLRASDSRRARRGQQVRSS